MSEERAQKLREYDGPDKVISAQEMHLLLGDQADGLYNIKCGIPGLDDAMGGFQDGELIVISGETKNGKTLLSQSMTVGFTKQQHFPLWFSYEVPARQFLAQFPMLPMIYMPEKLKSHAMNWFYDRCDEAHAKYGTRIIFIDHLHYLIDMAQAQNASIQIGNIIRNLKLFAVSRHYTIFLMCHTTKLAQGQDLSYHCIRDSSIISQESDSVIMVKRTPDSGENTARARVEFHRRTGVMNRIVGLVKTGGLLRECVYDEPEETDSTQYKRRAYR